jgi:hypothetical protein
MQATNGGILVTGAAGSIWLVYVAAYMYYTKELDAEIAATEAKRQAAAAKKALKQKSESDQKGKDVDTQQRKKIVKDSKKEQETKEEGSTSTESEYPKKKGLKFWKKDE